MAALQAPLDFLKEIFIEIHVQNNVKETHFHDFDKIPPLVEYRWC